MYFNPQPIISSMQNACSDYNKSINRVLQSWDDRVSDSMQTSCIGRLTQTGQSAASTMYQHGNNISNILSEMEFFARR